MHIVWTEILHPAHFLLATDFCCKTETDSKDAVATEQVVRTLGGFERGFCFSHKGELWLTRDLATQYCSPT